MCRINFAFNEGKKRSLRRQLRLLRSFHVWLCSRREAWGPAGEQLVQHLTDAEEGTAPSPSLGLLQVCCFAGVRTQLRPEGQGGGEQSRWSSSVGRMKSSLCRQPCFPAADRSRDEDFK